MTIENGVVLSSWHKRCLVRKLFLKVKELASDTLVFSSKMSTKRKFENLLFVDVSADPKYPSKVWLHFKLEKNAGIAKCNNCGSLIEDFSVTGMIMAAMIKHSNICLKQTSANPNKMRKLNLE